MDELFHHYYGEIYGKTIPNHYHTERHPDAVSLLALDLVGWRAFPCWALY
jgi:hypothetical protein